MGVEQPPEVSKLEVGASHYPISATADTLSESCTQFQFQLPLGQVAFKDRRAKQFRRKLLVSRGGNSPLFGKVRRKIAQLPDLVRQFAFQSRMISLPDVLLALILRQCKPG